MEREASFDQFLREFENGIRRFINGDAALIHRHADPLIDKTAPATVIRR